MKNLRLTALSAAFVILAGFIAACGETAPVQDAVKNNDFSDTEIIAELPDTTEITDNIPQGTRFDGETFTVLCREDLDWANEIITDEMNGEIVNDAIYERERTVEERFGVDIQVFRTPGIWGNESKFNDKIKGAVQSGDNSYQLVAGYAYFITSLASKGFFTNLLTVPYLDFDAPWWNSNLRDELTLFDQLYFAGGDLSYTMLQQMFACFYNKDMGAAFGVEDLYSVVRNGAWTYDYIYSLAASISNDVNGDGVMDVNDEYGLVLPIGNVCDMFFPAFDQPLTAKDDDGNVVLRMGDQKAHDLAAKVLRLFTENDGVFALSESDDYGIPFKEGRALLIINSLGYSKSTLRNLEINFGILPIPKYDENQDAYHTLSQDAYYLFCVPLNAGNLEMIGAVTEAMACESYKHVTPAYYEVAMKYKYSQDADTVEMLDIIREGALFNFGFVNSSSCNDMIHILRDVVNCKKDYASLYARNESKYQKSLDKLVEAYREMTP